MSGSPERRDLDPSALGSTLGYKLPGWFQTYFEHVLSGNGYQFWSGIGSDIGELTLVTAFAIFIRQRNCHVYRCWRLAWHPHPVHGHPVCRHHHPDHRRITAAFSDRSLPQTPTSSPPQSGE